MFGVDTGRGFNNMLRISNLSISQGTQPMLRNVSLELAPGEVVTLMGASGSGKSTLLSWMIGHVPALFSASGTLELNGKRVDALPTELRKIGILFQDDVLFMHLNVGQNLAFALPAHIKGSKARRHAIEHTLAEMGMAGFHDRDPATLSGGQRARVSLMRALLAEPQALLLDEPFSKLDSALRSQFRTLVFEHVKRLQIPTLLVTHDLADVPPAGRVLDIAQWKPHHV